MNLVITNDALYQLSYISICIRLNAFSIIPNRTQKSKQKFCDSGVFLQKREKAPRIGGISARLIACAAFFPKKAEQRRKAAPQAEPLLPFGRKRMNLFRTILVFPSRKKTNEFHSDNPLVSPPERKQTNLFR